MSILRHRSAGLACLGVPLLMAACGDLGKVEQGRVIAYNKQTRQVTLIREAPSPAHRSDPGVLPPVTVAAPVEPAEMGPAPAAGGLMSVDYKRRRIVIYDRAAQSFRTIDYTPLAERRDVLKPPGPPVVDRSRKTVTLYVAAEHALITFALPDDLLALPPETWRAGDVVRYYYKNPAQALRLMNVTKTDLSKSG
jgi:hypothetical protein